MFSSKYNKYLSLYRGLIITVAVFLFALMALSGLSRDVFAETDAPSHDDEITTEEETLETEKEPESVYPEEYEIIDEVTISENPPPMLETEKGTLPQTEETLLTSEQQSSESDTVDSTAETSPPPEQQEDKKGIKNDRNGDISIYILAVIFICVLLTSVPVIILRNKKDK